MPNMREAVRSIKKTFVDFRKSSAQIITQVTAVLTEEQLKASKTFTNNEVDYFGPFTLKMGQKQKRKAMVLSVHMSIW